MASRVQSAHERVADEKWRARIRHACAMLEADVCAESIAVCGDLALALARDGRNESLLVAATEASLLDDFAGESLSLPLAGADTQVKLCPRTSENAAALRQKIPFLAPIVPAAGVSMGMGDRLGLATPGHIRAVQGSGILPVTAQQSIRELMRTGRSPQAVLDDAMWGAFQTGYRDGYAADADHLKTVEHIDTMLEAGFTMYTIDPGGLVENSASRMRTGELAARTAQLPWDALECTIADVQRRYADRSVTVAGHHGEFTIKLERNDVLRALVKYGRPIARLTRLYRHLASRRSRERFAFEVAVDETDSPTTAAEHFILASELRRLGVQWESLAPRFVGDFFKGVDYVGDLEKFRAEFRKHVIIAEHFGGYRLSLHSGSDKFSIYPIVADLAGDAIHIKTSGTSYLEALRVVATTNPDLFREIVGLARRRYEADRVEYRVGADIAKMAAVDRLRDDELPLALDQPDTRQICHVTFGAVLSDDCSDGRLSLRDRLLAELCQNIELYHRQLKQHFRRHISPFV